MSGEESVWLTPHLRDSQPEEERDIILYIHITNYRHM